ncbi:L-histidine N(alpha)-methyltransferase [Streptomyces sp. NPDC021093]|uniref:L-histidine N(alpha)-methyltransferase n=1 Tax=Streptomyces sp. NPDC021093 TaxID=3365112 RepID=UPI00378A6C00
MASSVSPRSESRPQAIGAQAHPETTTAQHHELLSGLTARPKHLATKWLYDACGSVLYTDIIRQPEYYIDEAEREIIGRHGAEIAALTRARSLVDLGSGSGRKTRLLIDALLATGSLEQCVPVDVSSAALRTAARALGSDYPGLRILPYAAEFTAPLDLNPQDGPVLLTFFGATFGNFRPLERRRFLAALRGRMRPGDALLLGTDLVKDVATMTAAYDDRAGVTAAFVKNGLTVLNRELDATFRQGDFTHRVTWNPHLERVENALQARRAHRVDLAALGRTISFDHGELLHVGVSTKFRERGVREEAAATDLRVSHWWTDNARRYAVSLITVADHAHAHGTHPH